MILGSTQNLNYFKKMDIAPFENLEIMISQDLTWNDQVIELLIRRPKSLIAALLDLSYNRGSCLFILYYVLNIQPRILYSI